MCIYSHYLLLILYLELILSHRIIKRFDTKSSIYKGCVSSIFIVDKNNSLIHNCASKFDTVFQELNSQDKRPVSYTHLDVYKRQVRTKLRLIG